MEFDENDPIRYDHWIEDALRGVIRQALAFTAENGIIGEHHFYVTFRTDTDAITLPDYLRVQHPHEMTIVLQHQYENLSVEEDRFFVTLRFNGQAVNLDIPFDEITGFTDPSVNFGLQLKTTEVDEDDLEEYDYPFEPPAVEQDRAQASTTLKPVSTLQTSKETADDALDTIGKAGTGKGGAGKNTGKKDKGGGDTDTDDAPADDAPTGEVIALDAFRKK